MIKKEWNKLLHNKMLLISSIVILFIPILYAGFFLKSNWDPYGNTDNLPVAVVNLDKPVNYEGKELAIGDELVSNLQDNDALDWHFVSKDDAQKGLENRDYYMVMTLPRNLSEDASTLMDDKPKKMQIDYETNGSLNYISEIISGTAVKEIKSTVSANVTEAYAEAVFDQIGDIGEGFEEAADGADELNDGTEKLKDGNEAITTNLKTLANSTLTFSDGADVLNMGLSTYADGVSQVNSGAQQLNNGISSLSSNVGPLKDGVNQLDTGASSLNQGVQSYTNGVAALDEGLGQLSANGPALRNGAAALSDGVSQVKNGSGQLLTGLKTLSSKLNGSLDQDQQAQLSALVDKENGLPKINAGIQKLNRELQKGIGNVGNAAKGLDKQKVEENLKAIGSELSGIGENLEASKTALNQTGDKIAEAGAQIEPNVQKAVEAVGGTEAFQSLSPEQQEEIVSTLTGTLSKQGATQAAALEKAGDQLASVGSNTAAVGKKVTAAGSSAKELVGQMQALQTQLEQLPEIAATLPKLVDSVDQLAKGSEVAIPGAVQAITSLRNGLTGIQAAVNSNGDNPGLIQGVEQLDSGLSAVQAGIDGKNGLVTGLAQYTTGVDQAYQGAAALNNNSSALTAGSSALSSGLGQMSNQLPALTDGISQLNQGADALAEGTLELDSNSGQLLNGSNQLAEGSGQIHNGSEQLADGSTKLGSGIGALSYGTDELAGSLKDGAEEVNNVEATEDTLSMFASPTEIDHKEYSHVPNYGVALAPYILSMALYIGAVVFNTIYPVRKMAIKDGTTVSWWSSKLSIALLSAALMGLIETGIMLAIGLPVEHIGQFLLLAVVTSMAFMSIVLFLSVSFDNVGRFIAMLLLIVQLGGSGGTFPIPLTNRFFEAIHPFLPMTYSVYGFRQAISDGLGQGVYIQAILLMLVIAVVFCGFLFLSMKHLNHKYPNGFIDEDELAAEETPTHA